MTRRQRVARAIGFGNPDRVPIWFFNRDVTSGDIMRFEFSISEGLKSEWGYTWRRLDDGTMGQPTGAVVPSWEDLASYDLPRLRSKERLAGIEAFREESTDRYLLCGLGISGFTVYTFLRGFQNAMTDLALEPERACVLLDRIFDFECELISLAADAGLHGVHFEDDWGTQSNLTVSPAMWRSVFKPRYRRQFEHAHSLGMTVWFHSCGNILPIVFDLHEIGCDVLNISQPNVVDIAEVGRLLRGKQCFMAPVSYQTVSITGTPEDIRAEAKRLHETLGAPLGGFIGYVEEYGCMGMSEENYQACAHAFEDMG